MKYFKEIALWKIVLLNLIVGICMSGPFLFSLVLTFGIIRGSKFEEKIIGIFIFFIIIILILLANFILWTFANKKITELINKENKKSSYMKLFIVLIILFMTVASFFVCPDIWLIFNGGWF